MGTKNHFNFVVISANLFHRLRVLMTSTAASQLRIKHWYKRVFLLQGMGCAPLKLYQIVQVKGKERVVKQNQDATGPVTCKHIIKLNTQPILDGKRFLLNSQQGWSYIFGVRANHYLLDYPFMALYIGITSLQTN